MEYIYLTVAAALRNLFANKPLRHGSIRKYISVRDSFGLPNGGDDELEDFIVPEGVSFFLMHTQGK